MGVDRRDNLILDPRAGRLSRPYLPVDRVDHESCQASSQGQQIGQVGEVVRHGRSDYRRRPLHHRELETPVLPRQEMQGWASEVFSVLAVPQLLNPRRERPNFVTHVLVSEKSLMVLPVAF